MPKHTGTEHNPTIRLPGRFTSNDAEIIALAIANAKQLLSPFDSDFKAPWLLTDPRLHRWETTNRGREEFVDGKWKNTISIDWQQRLPDGYLLTDPKHSRLFQFNMSLAAHSRSGKLGKSPTPITWRREVGMSVNLTRWTVLNEAQYQPDTYGLQLLDQNALDSLMRLLAEGGWTTALQVPERLFRVLYKSAFNEVFSADEAISVHKLPQDIRLGIQNWLERNRYFKTAIEGPHKGKRFLSRTSLSQALGEPGETLGSSWKLSAFLRQFETDYFSNGLLVSVSQYTEMPSHKIGTIDETINRGSSENSFNTIVSYLSKLFSAYRYFPNELPSANQVSVLDAQHKALNLTRTGGHTHFIPINTGLAYLNNAIRLVHVYGESIIDCYLAATRTKRRCPDMESSEILNSINASAEEHFLVDTPEGKKPLLAVLGIMNFQRGSRPTDFDLLRSQPTLFEMLRVLIGACIVCIGILKPSREYELTHLKRDCLRKDATGYYIHYVLGKSNVGEAYIEIDRPIPFITVKAVRLLQKLGSSLADLFSDDTKIGKNLFYLPKVEQDGALVATEVLLNQHLDLFCDYVGIPPDQLGRRWYVRVHEMRKWFLLLLFWSGKYDVLDAARWIAGHTDAKHIYEYIEQEFPGQELPRLEAEYAVERLRALESKTAIDGCKEEGLTLLYQKVLDHFGVNSLAMVPESEWVDYVSLLREMETFILEPHSVFAEGSNSQAIGIEVAFTMRERA